MLPFQKLRAALSTLVKVQLNLVLTPTQVFGVLALSIMDSVFKSDGDVVSAILIVTNAGLLWLCAYSADHIRRVKNSRKIQALFSEVMAAEADDKAAFDRLG